MDTDRKAVESNARYRHPRIAGFSASDRCQQIRRPRRQRRIEAAYYFEGEAILDEPAPAPYYAAPKAGFCRGDGCGSAVDPDRCRMAMSEPNGQVAQGFSRKWSTLMRAGARRRCRSMAVYLCAHGAAITTERGDPEGVI